MTDAELIAALDAAAIAVDDARWGPRIIEARRALALGDPDTAANIYTEVVWAAYMGGGAMYGELRALAVELDTRRVPAHPIDFEPPYRYGHMYG